MKKGKGGKRPRSGGQGLTKPKADPKAEKRRKRRLAQLVNQTNQARADTAPDGRAQPHHSWGGWDNVAARGIKLKRKKHLPTWYCTLCPTPPDGSHLRRLQQQGLKSHFKDTHPEYLLEYDIRSVLTGRARRLPGAGADICSWGQHNPVDHGERGGLAAGPPASLHAAEKKADALSAREQSRPGMGERRWEPGAGPPHTMPPVRDGDHSDGEPRRPGDGHHASDHDDSGSDSDDSERGSKRGHDDDRDDGDDGKRLRAESAPG